MIHRKKTQTVISFHVHLSKLMLSFLFSVIAVVTLHAQQYNQWVFGNNASYDFTTDMPLPTAPPINSIEDAAMWCDGAGNLMFYTDGKSIFNSAGTAICTGCMNGNPNGGGGSQGVLIVPNVAAGPNDFYIFTVSDRKFGGPGCANRGLEYYTFNFVTGFLSTATQMGFTAGTFGSYTTEALTACAHPNGVDYWVVVKPIIVPPATPTYICSPPPANQPAGATNTSLYAYLVTAAGVSPTPVISEANYSAHFGTTPLNVSNEIKFSPDGHYASYTNRTMVNGGHTNLYRFNSSTGQFMFLQTLPMLNNYSPYGASFSPNSRVLYVSGTHDNFINSFDDEVLRQYDLWLIDCDPYSPAPSCDFNTTVDFPLFGNSTKMQLTPDGRIFRARLNGDAIDVINTPNNIGCANIDYQAQSAQAQVGDAIPLTEFCRNGLPNNIDALPGMVTMSTSWPKTTTNTISVDNGVALDVDQAGNVYSTGTFKQSTQFGPFTIIGAGIESSYLVKYTACGEEDWVARGIPTTPFGFVTCHSMDTWNTQGMVFVSGRFRGNATFFSGIGAGPPPCPMPGGINITGSGIFIAYYSYNGCLLGVHTIQDDANYIHNSAHITTGSVSSPSSQNRVYVAVNETPLTTSNRMRVYAFNLAGTLNPAWIVPLRALPGSEVIDISMSGSRIAITGTYNGPLYWNMEGFPFTSTIAPANEAFVVTMVDMNGFLAPNKVNSQSRGFDPGPDQPRSSGSGVCVVGNTVFLTGTYIGVTSGAFGTSALTGNGANSCAYAVRLNPGAGANWAHSFSCDGTTFGHDVVARFGVGGAVYFTGTWTNDNVFNIDATAMPATVPMKNHIYVVKMPLNGNFMAATAWQNHSYMNNDAAEHMKPARIALFSNDWVYVNGSYMGTAQMDNDFAINSPLTSTTGTFNSFVWRYRASVDGTSLRVAQEEDVQTEIEQTSIQLNVFPNPAQTTLTIQLNTPQENTNIEIYNSSGQLMTSFITSASSEMVDVSEWAMGIYFVRIESEGEVVTEKFIRN